jgi:hypothetical protein
MDISEMDINIVFFWYKTASLLDKYIGNANYFPVKFLDLLLIYHSMAENISSGFLFIERKR